MSSCSAEFPRIASSPVRPGEGWWPEMVGPGLGVDTRQYRVLGIDYIGGRGDSATPDVGGQFPPHQLL